MTQSLEGDVQLGDVVRIALPLSTTIYANQTYSRKLVSWITVLLSGDKLSDQVSAGDLVIVPKSVQAKFAGAAFEQLLRKIATLRCVGVVMFGEKGISAEKLAKTHDLPIFIISDDTSLRTIHKSIAALLIDRQKQISERGMQLYRELSEMSREGTGLDQMAGLIGQLTGKIVVIQDKRLEVQAISRPLGSIEIEDDNLHEGLREKDNLPAVLRNRKAAAKSNRTHWQQLLFPHHNIARLVSPIISGDRARGYLSIIGPASELDLLDAVAVEQGSAACALEMAKAKAISEAKKALRGNFLEGILAGNIPQKEIDRLATRLDHDTDLPHAVMSFKWSEESDLSLRRIETTLNWMLSTNNKETLVHIYGDDHISVFQSLRRSDDLTEAQTLARRLRQQLASEFPGAKLLAGLSGPVHHLTEWPQAHREALQAMGVGQRLNLNEVVEYSSLGVYRLLGQLDDVPAVHEFCDTVIGPLVHYDREHRSNLVQTIEEYFNHHGNVSQTAEALFIHRNTLLYRLERIQDLTGHELNKAEMRLALHLALKLWQLRPNSDFS